MSPHEFQSAYKAAGLSLNGFARRYGVNATTARRWAGGDQDVPLWVAVALNDLRLLQDKEPRT